MKLGKFLPFTIIISLLCGCGHSVLLEHEVTGFSLRVPVCEGADLGLSVGMVKSTMATIRGGTSLETVSSAGGGVFSGDGGINKITTFKTNTQLNEGNLVKVMTSPECPNEAKVIMASNLCDAVKAPKFASQVLQTERTTIHTGAEAIQSNAVERITRPPSGIDRLGDNVRDIANNTINNATEVITNTEDNVQLTLSDWIDAIRDFFSPLANVKWIVIIAIIGIVIIVVVLLRNVFGLFHKSDNKTKKKETSQMTFASGSESTKSVIEDVDVIIPDRSEEIAAPVSKPSIWSRIKAVFDILVVFFSRIPPEYKQQLKNMIVNWVKTHKKTKSSSKKK